MILHVLKGSRGPLLRVELCSMSQSDAQHVAYGCPVVLKASLVERSKTQQDAVQG